VIDKLSDAVSVYKLSDAVSVSKEAMQQVVDNLTPDQKQRLINILNDI
jgi:divalent metal cation (Fe/Co/Zn/Cd) transporter